MSKIKSYNNWLSENNEVDVSSNQTKIVYLETFPENVLNTLKDEYGQYFLYKYDWNEKQDEFLDNAQGFKKWLRKHESEEFIKNIDKLIRKTRQDLILLKRVKITETALDYFEKLIIPALSNEVLVGPISVFMYKALMKNNTIEDINDEFKKAKDIIDNDGSLNIDKVTPSKIFVDDMISLPNFERFAEDNPEYMGVFNDWKKLFDKNIKLTLQELNAYSNSTTYKEIKELYEFLIEYKKLYL